ncbi:hypothetical protein [Salmonella phage SSBI34]|nr:hypothetical protein [Salmonella phage SSBI34]
MNYLSSEKVNFEIGDLVVNRGYDNSKIVEVVTFVGVEGVTLLCIGGVIGFRERYVKFRDIVKNWPDIIHKRNTEEFKSFMEKMK